MIDSLTAQWKLVNRGSLPVSILPQLVNVPTDGDCKSFAMFCMENMHPHLRKQNANVKIFPVTGAARMN